MDLTKYQIINRLIYRILKPFLTNVVSLYFVIKFSVYIIEMNLNVALYINSLVYNKTNIEKEGFD